MVRAVEWKEGKVRFIDQMKLPLEERYVETDDMNVVAEAIKTLSIRGAPLIGIAAAYAVVLAAGKIPESDSSNVRARLDRAINTLAGTRPTAANLFWALKRQRSVIDRNTGSSIQILREHLLQEALLIHEEDRAMCRNIGRLGAELLPHAAVVLTHCNTGSLATGGDGTAQSIIATAWEHHTLKHVYIDETRPLLQGARLTTWELQKLGVPATLITDTTAAFLMQRRQINAVVVGADRITLNGDVANKVGTYGLAVLAKHHEIGFYVAAPTSTIDFEMESGKDIPIEQRNASEVTEISGIRIAPNNIDVYSPAFDITPHELVTAIVTEKNVLRPPFGESVARLKPSGEHLRRETAKL